MHKKSSLFVYIFVANGQFFLNKSVRVCPLKPEIDRLIDCNFTEKLTNSQLFSNIFLNFNQFLFSRTPLQALSFQAHFRSLQIQIKAVGNFWKVGKFCEATFKRKIKQSEYYRYPKLFIKLSFLCNLFYNFFSLFYRGFDVQLWVRITIRLGKGAYNYSHKEVKDSLETRAERFLLRVYVENHAN